MAGIDEAGRGPLAGPVVAAAVVFDRRFLEAEELGLLKGLTDSKKLSASRREHFFKIIPQHADVGIGSSDVAAIDRINILNATHAAMAAAVKALSALPDHILVDGLLVPGLACESTAIVGGDGKSLSIAAASVMAKVTRDARMKEFDLQYPQYGFAKHKGYGSKAHIQALLEYGPCPIHRMTFGPVREAAAIHARSGNNGEDR